MTPPHEFDDGDKLFSAVIRHSYRHDAAAGDFLNRRLDVVRIVIGPIHDQEILDAARDEQFAFENDAEVSGPQPRTFWCAGRGTDKLCTERPLGELGVPPVAHGDVVPLHPDFTDRSRRILLPGFGVDDSHR